MTERLPVEFDPQRLANSGELLSACLPVAHFKRLLAELQSAEGEVQVSVTFSRDNAYRVRATGQVQTAVQLCCQRCLGAFNCPLESEFEFVFVDSEERAEALPEELDALLVDERGRIRAVDMLEDELLLQLPIVPKHADEHDCAVNLVYKAQPTDPKPRSTRENPFASLAGLKKND